MELALLLYWFYMSLLELDRGTDGESVFGVGGEGVRDVWDMGAVWVMGRSGAGGRLQFRMIFRAGLFGMAWLQERMRCVLWSPALVTSATGDPARWRSGMECISTPAGGGAHHIAHGERKVHGCGGQTR